MSGFIRAPDPKREVMRSDAIAWREPDCEICSLIFGTTHCKHGSFGRLEIVEEYHLDNSHVIHIVAPHYTYAQLDSLQVMATMDESQFQDPFGDAVRVLAHLGFEYMDGVIANG